VPGDLFRVVLRVNTEGNITITGLQAHDANPGDNITLGTQTGEWLY